MKKMIFILFSLIISLQVFGQEVEDGTTISRGKIHTVDSEVIEGQYIVFMKDSLEYYLNNSEERYTIGLNKVNKVMKYDGNYSQTGLWLGTIGGAVLGVVVALGTEETNTSQTGYLEITETSIQTWPIYLFTGIGSLIGMLIGESAEDWETIYSNNTAFLKNIQINNNQLGTHISYKFRF